MQGITRSPPAHRPEQFLRPRTSGDGHSHPLTCNPRSGGGRIRGVGGTGGIKKSSGHSHQGMVLANNSLPTTVPSNSRVRGLMTSRVHEGPSGSVAGPGGGACQEHR